MIGTDATPTGWRWAHLGELGHPEGRSIVSGPFGSNIGRRFFVTEGVPIIRGSNLTTDLTRFVDDGFVYVTPAKAEELSACWAIPGDLVFTAAGSLGQVGLIPHDARYPVYVISNKQMRVRLDPAKIDALFAFYWLSSPTMVRYVEQRNTGSSVPLINLSVLRDLPVPLPPLPEQIAIASILGSLDDKIELNRRMNGTLEALAKAVFRSWFVDFDPVTAKVQGREPVGMDTATAALFPDELEDSDLGEVPKGWKVSTIGDEVEVVGGSTPSTSLSEYWDNGEHHWVTPKDLRSLASPVLLDTERRITDSGLHQIGSGLLPVGTVLLSSRAPIGYLVITEVPVAINQGFIGMICSGRLPSHYVLQWTRHSMETIVSHANGTTFLEISKRNFRPIPVLVPSPEVLDAYVHIVEPMHRLVVGNMLESQTLAAVRGALLPRLLSGQLRAGPLREGTGGDL